MFVFTLFSSFDSFGSIWPLSIVKDLHFLRSPSDFHYLEVADEDSFETFGCSRNPSPGVPVSTFGWEKPKSRSSFGWASFGGFQVFTPNKNGKKREFSKHFLQLQMGEITIPKGSCANEKTDFRNMPIFHLHILFNLLCHSQESAVAPFLGVPQTCCSIFERQR